jgi:hypothetical protein
MNGQRRDDPRRRRKGMTTLVLDKKTERTTIGEVLNSATEAVLEIRDESGRLLATVLFSEDDDGFDYAPYLAEVERNMADLDRRARHPGPWLTTEQFLDGLSEPGE